MDMEISAWYSYRLCSSLVAFEKSGRQGVNVHAARSRPACSFEV